MAKTDKRKMESSKSPEAPKKAASTPEGADTWIDDRVRALFQSVIDEPLPEDMLAKLTKKRPH